MNDELLTTTRQTDDFIDDYMEALDAVPVEVRAFMWSEAFTLILTAISDAHKLSPIQRSTLKGVVMETLVGTITPISRQIKLSDVGITGDLQDSILKAIQEEIVSRALTQIELYNELHENDTVSEENSPIPTLMNTPTTNAPSPLQAIASIKERLAKPSFIAPTTRDYSVARPDTPSATTDEPVVTPPSSGGADMYRELPEK